MITVWLLPALALGDWFTMGLSPPPSPPPPPPQAVSTAVNAMSITILADIVQSQIELIGNFINFFVKSL
ncbi:MAG: hypothetical protein ACJAYG_001188 [Oceanicoccus sp.]